MTWARLFGFSLLLAVASQAATASAEPIVRSRTFAVATTSKSIKGILTLDLLATSDPNDASLASHIEIHVGPLNKPLQQVLKAKVDAGMDVVLGSAETIDIDFDGHLDFWFVREMGAKWARYEAFVFDPKTGRFVQDAVTREISKLTNPTIDPASHTIASETIGPSMPTREIRRVEKGRLVVVERCEFDNSKDTNQDDMNDGVLVIKRLVKGVLATVVNRSMHVRLGDNPCAASRRP